jgi:predicted acylesterase/phospholipase RssA
MRIPLVAATLALTGCVSTPAPRAINLAASTTENASAAEKDDLPLEGDVLVVALSGGGARAAAFSLGALKGLSELKAADGASLLDHVRIVSGVSGGAILAAYYGQHGPAGIDTFRAAYLDKIWDIHESPFSPLNWMRALNGGVNDRSKLAAWLNREVFADGTMNQVWNGRGGQVWINATDLYNGTTFAFAPPYFAALCSDLGTVRIADAVAASMAVPIAFAPVLAVPYPDHCAPPPAWIARAANDHAGPAGLRRTAQAFIDYRDPEKQRYLHLVDGGVLDNLGLTSLSLERQIADTSIGPLSPRSAVRLHRMNYLIINAQNAFPTKWQFAPAGPSGAEVASRLVDVVVESPNRASYDLFRNLVRDWEQDVRTFRCALSAEEVKRYRGDTAGWDCKDVRFVVDMVSFSDLGPDVGEKLGDTPTAVSLPRDTVDALIAGGREGVKKNASLQALMH